MNSLIQRLLVARTTRAQTLSGLIDAVLEQLPIGKPGADPRRPG